MGAATECRGRMGDDIDDEDGVRLLGDSKWWPPGFRFHPTDEELVLFYLKRKICRRRIKLDMIGDVDVYKWEPWELPEKSVMRSGDKQWYYFSPRDRKYPNGSRSNRATKCGYWKTTGKDRTISQNSKAVGNKKTLVYYHGRAPKGARTDWVMHEYTLDELVLKGCNNAQVSYALYKVFRKSGPGPKNGEQYGAPFREEEWDDDAPHDNFRNQTDREDLTNEHLNGDSVSSVLVDDSNTLPVCDRDLEDLLLQMSSEQDVIKWYPECSAYVAEIDVGAEVGSHIMRPLSYVDANSTQYSGTCCEQGIVETTNFQIAPPASASYVQPIEVPEVTSLTNCPEQGQVRADEEFLEIKDFNDPESVDWSMDDISHSNHIHEADGFYDSYDYFDAQMYLTEAMGHIDGTSTNSYLDGLGNDEIQNQTSLITSELWTYEQACNVSTTADSNQVVMATPNSGVVYANSLSDLGGGPGGVTQGPISSVASPSDSWFSSAFSAFLDSVPSSPAFASENVVISRALERVSSFRAGQIRGGGEPFAATGCGGAALGRRRGGHNGGFLFISFLVGLGAILWVVSIGAAVKVIKGFWGRFISS